LAMACETGAGAGAGAVGSWLWHVRRGSVSGIKRPWPGWVTERELRAGNREAFLSCGPGFGRYKFSTFSGIGARARAGMRYGYTRRRLGSLSPVLMPMLAWLGQLSLSFRSRPGDASSGQRARPCAAS
jgi:hypothetical protein